MPLGLDQPALLVVSDGSGDRRRVLELGRGAARGGAWGFLVREPRLGGRELQILVEELVSEEPRTRIIVSDRVDVALIAGGFGVELGERSFPISRVRSWVGERLRLGRSIHDVAGARAAVAGGADWLVFGHVFPTPSKAGMPPAGHAGLRAIVEAAAGCPVLAIGGIDASRVGEVVKAGARGVAVIGAVARSGDPALAVRELVRALAAAGEE